MDELKIIELRESVFENNNADAALLQGQTHARHTGHIFGDGDRARIHFADELVGQLQIGDRLDVRIIGEVLVVRIEVHTQAVIMIEHARHTIEAETVKMIFRHPELEV